MRIQGIQVDGFGVWTGLELQGIGEGLGLVFGPNEAGKTTLLELIRSVLYGFTASRRRYLPPPGGGPWGGWLELGTADGPFRVGRHLEDGPAGPKERLHVLGPDGEPREARTLDELLFDVDEQTFDHVFAVGLRELQYLGTLDETRAAALLYNLSIGLDRVSLPEVMSQLNDSRNQILDARGGPCQLVHLEAERARLCSEIDQLSGGTRRYERLAQETRRIDEQLARLNQQQTQCRHQTRLVELAVGLRERWAQRRAIDGQLEPMGPVRSVPQRVTERLDQIGTRLREQEQQLTDLVAQREQLREELRSLPVNQAVRREADTIQTLADQQPRLAALQQQLAGLRAEVERLEGELRSREQQLGFDPNHPPRALPAPGRRTLGRLRGPAALLRSARGRWQEATAQAAEAQQNVEALEEELRRALGTRQVDDLSAALEQTSELVGRLRNRMRLDERLEQMAANRRELEEQSRSLVAGQMLPGWVLVGLGAVFVLGMVLVLVGLLMPESITGSLGWALALLGLGGAGVAGLGKLLLERSAAGRLEACQMQMRMLQGQIEQARQQRDETDRRLQAAGVAISSASLPTRLQSAQEELAALEAAVPLQSRLAAVGQEAEAAEHRAAEAKRQYAQARKQWREVLAAANLPERLSPRGVRRWLRRAEQLEPFHRRVALRREDLCQRAQEFEALADRIRATAERVGVGQEARTPEEQLARLAGALQTERSLAARRRELRRQNRQLARRQSRVEEVVRRLKGVRRSLLRRAGVRTEQQLRELAVRAARAEALRKERSELDQAIAQAIGRPEDQAAVYRLLEAETPAEQLAAQREQLRSELERLEAERTRRYEQRGRVAEQMRTLAAHRTLARKQLELSRLEQRMAQAARRWQVLAVCCRIFDELKHNYQKHRQPETLLEASNYLARLTEGRYVRVWTPLDRDVLLVDTPDGDWLPVEALSRGTREQLFLGLRLALAACYARRGMALPLVLDDVLVNFDAARAKAAAGVLRDFASAGHQVLLFTCHDHLMKLFKSLKAPIAQLPDSSRVPAGSVSFTSAARSSRRRTSDRGSGRESVFPARREAPADSTDEVPEQEPDAQVGPHIRTPSADDSLAALPEPPPVPESTPEDVPDERPARGERVA